MRKGLTKQKVSEACEELWTSGTPITAVNVRKQCGDTGSFSTIAKYITEWESEQQKDLTQNNLPIPSSLLDASNRHIQRMYNYAFHEATNWMTNEQIEILERENESLKDKVEYLQEEAMKVEILQNQVNQLQTALQEEAVKRGRMEVEMENLKREWQQMLKSQLPNKNS